MIYGEAYSGCQAGVLAVIGGGDPFVRQKEVEMKMKLRYGGETDPEKPPEPEKGDQYIVIGAIAGLIVGGIVGAVIGGYCFGLGGGITGALIGIVAGGIMGTQIGKRMKNRRQSAKTSKPKPF
jgi:outer membrane lipoprotein SlyB